MYIDKVNISETYEIYNGEKILRWKKIEANVNLSAGEDSMQGANFVQEFINEWNNRTNVIQSNPLPQTLSTQPKLSQEETIIRDIHTCTELKTLQAYKLIAKNNPTIQEHYTAKLSELSQ